MKFFLSFLLLILFLLNPGFSLAQNDVLQNLPLGDPTATSSQESIRDDVNSLDGLAAGEKKYKEAKDNFFNKQTITNKKIFDKAAVAWAKQLVSAQLRFLQQQKLVFQSLVEKNQNIPAGWLEKEKADLEDILSDLEKSKGYASAASLLNRAADVWRTVDKKINQVRAFSVYNNFLLLTNKAKSLHDSLAKQQALIKTRMVDSEKSVWDNWELIFSTYTEKLSEIEKTESDLFGSFEELPDWKGLDESDSLWEKKLSALKKILLDFESLQVLQAKVVNDYYKVLANLVPVKKSAQP